MIDRYSQDQAILNGKSLGTNVAIIRLREAINSGRIRTTSFVMTDSERLDMIAQRYYNDGRLWWVIAAASGIGWWLQVPAGTRIVVPVDINEVNGVLQ